MKLRTLAAAISAGLAVPAMAQNVTVSGVFKPGFEVTKRTGQNGQNQVVDNSSRFILSGSEDLGGGLRAIFQVDTRFATDNTTGQQASDGGAGTRTATEIGNGNTWAGITGPWGELRVGKNDLHYNEMGVLLDGSTNLAGNLEASASAGILSQVTGNGAAARTIAMATRTPNLIKYDSPKMGPWTFTAAYSSSIGASATGGATDTRDGAGGASNAAKTNGGSANNLVARYAQGPFSAVGSYWTAKTENRQTAGDIDQRGIVIGGRVTLGATRLSAVYNDSQTKTVAGVRNQRTAYGVSLDHDLSSSMILHFNYSVAGNLEVDNVTAENTGADHMTLGVSYLLSKRTSAGFYWTKLDNKANARYQLFNTTAGAAANGDTYTSAYLGLRHAF